jgi:AraC-like DNA-binding protein
VDHTVFMVAHQPGGALRDQVHRVAGFAEHAGEAVPRRELPHAGVTLILSLGEPIRISSATGSGVYTSFLAGLHQIPVDTEHDGTLRCIQVDLSPLGAYRLLGMPMSELADTVIGLEQLARPGWRDLGERLAGEASWPDRFQLLERAVADLARNHPVEDPEVGWAWRALAGSHGNVPIGRLAAEVGWSRRHFAARFRQQVGLTPKSAAQLLRFSRALSMLSGSRPISEVAAEAGYADHSHLVREFRRLTGSTPSQLLAGSHSSNTATVAPV